MNQRSQRVRFRHHSAITVAAVIAVIGGVSLASWAPYLLPLLVIPAAVAGWSWRAGTDVGPDGLTVRATMARRWVPWSVVEAVGVGPRGRAVARLSTGSLLRLPAVAAADLPRLVEASGAGIIRPTDADPDHVGPRLTLPDPQPGLTP